MRPRPASSWILTARSTSHAFTLADPYRVVLDIPQVTFQLPPKAGEAGRGLIKAFRYGLVMPGGSRMVFDLTKPVRVDKAFVVDAADGAPARLVLDLAADRSRQLFAQDRRRRKGAAGTSIAANRLPPTAPQANAADPRPLVVLDPGHGGIDTGTKAAERRMREGHRARFRPCGCATASRRPANTAC